MLLSLFFLSLANASITLGQTPPVPQSGSQPQGGPKPSPLPPTGMPQAPPGGGALGPRPTLPPNQYVYMYM